MNIKKQLLNELTNHYNNTGEILTAAELNLLIDCDKTYYYKVIKEFKRMTEKDNTTEEDKNVKISGSKNSLELQVNVDEVTIHTLDQVLEIGNVDTNIWEVDRYVINPWSVTMKGPDKTPIRRNNWQVKVWLKRKKTNYLESGIKELIDDIDGIRLNFTVNPKRETSGYAGEIALYDAHFGKFSWHEETLMGNWDVEICKNAYLEGCEKGLIHMQPYNPEKIFFIFGNDFMHFENIFAKTPMSGHSLDVDGRLSKVAKTAMQSVIEAINMCRSVAPVEVIWIPGNHDIHASMWLSLILDTFYRNDKYVNIDNSASSTKARLWGKLLVGWLHNAIGRKSNAAINMLPQFWPELWGKSTYRELHVGHQHKKVMTKSMPIDTVGGTIIRQIPSLSSIDYWHSESLFVDAVPAGEALLWNKETGVEAHYTANIKPITE